LPRESVRLRNKPSRAVGQSAPVPVGAGPGVGRGTAPFSRACTARTRWAYAIAGFGITGRIAVFSVDVAQYAFVNRARFSRSRNGGGTGGVDLSWYLVARVIAGRREAAARLFNVFTAVTSLCFEAYTPRAAGLVANPGIASDTSPAFGRGSSRGCQRDIGTEGREVVAGGATRATRAGSRAVVDSRARVRCRGVTAGAGYGRVDRRRIRICYRDRSVCRRCVGVDLRGIATCSASAAGTCGCGVRIGGGVAHRSSASVTRRHTIRGGSFFRLGFIARGHAAVVYGACHGPGRYHPRAHR
jgi:hypothetical protein